MGTSSSKDAAAIEEISHIELEEVDDEKESIYGSKFTAQSLWIMNKCAIILIVRRPGCPLCREQAQVLSKMVERLATHLTYKDDLSISLSAVVSEIQYQEDIQDFKSYFHLDCRSELCQFGNVFYDANKGFFKAQGFRKSSLANLLTKRVRAAISRATGKGIKGTLNGDGTVLGGLMVVSTDKIWYEYREEFFGDELRLPEILRAIGAATGKNFDEAPLIK